MVKNFSDSLSPGYDKLSSYVSVYENVLSEDSLNSFLDLVEFQSFSQETRASVGLINSTVNPNVRDAFFLRIPLCAKSLTNSLFNKVNLLLQNYIKDHFFYIQDTEFVHEQSFVLYKNQKGYTPHSDSTSFDSNKRIFTTITYFNDNFSGGEIYFPKLNLELPIKKNTTIIFPSSSLFTHGARRVHGRKMISPCWFGHEKKEKFVFPWEIV